MKTVGHEQEPTGGEPGKPSARGQDGCRLRPPSHWLPPTLSWVKSHKTANGPRRRGWLGKLRSLRDAGKRGPSEMAIASRAGHIRRSLLAPSLANYSCSEAENSAGTRRMGISHALVPGTHRTLEIAVFVYSGAATPRRTSPNGTRSYPPLFKASGISVATRALPQQDPRASCHPGDVHDKGKKEGTRPIRPRSLPHCST